MTFNEKDIQAITQWAMTFADISPDRILMGGNEIPHQFRAAVATQIELKSKLKIKLPHWAENPSIYIPSRLALEQCSGRLAASYKRLFIHEGDTIVDLTGGLGVDFLALMESAQKGFYFEQNKETAEAARHNIKLILQKGKEVNIFPENFFQQLPLIKKLHPDCIYLDPARRVGTEKRVYAITDCEPDIIPLTEELLPYTKSMIAKLSPMIDIQDTILSIPQTKELHVVAVQGEVKELVVKISSQEACLPIEKIPITAINLSHQKTSLPFTFNIEEEKGCCIEYANEVSQYVYEPHAAILKAGAFNTVASRFNLIKLHPNSHIYTSEICHTDFPGRIFELEQVIPFSSSTLKKISTIVPQASNSCRNFPLSPNEIRKRGKIADGGEKTLIATTNAQGEKLLLLLHKANKC